MVAGQSVGRQGGKLAGAYVSTRQGSPAGEDYSLLRSQAGAQAHALQAWAAQRQRAGSRLRSYKLGKLYSFTCDAHRARCSAPPPAGGRPGSGTMPDRLREGPKEVALPQPMQVGRTQPLRFTCCCAGARWVPPPVLAPYVLRSKWLRVVALALLGSLSPCYGTARAAARARVVLATVRPLMPSPGLAAQDATHAAVRMTVVGYGLEGRREAVRPRSI
jgi:hypothetical protein